MRKNENFDGFKVNINISIGVHNQDINETQS